MSVYPPVVREADALPPATLAPQVKSRPLAWLTALTSFRRRCPACGVCAMRRRYELPADYTEVSPCYYQCESCSARYLRVTFGPWIDASGPEFDRCYADAEER